MTEKITKHDVINFMYELDMLIYEFLEANVDGNYRKEDNLLKAQRKLIHIRQCLLSENLEEMKGELK